MPRDPKRPIASLQVWPMPPDTRMPFLIAQHDTDDARLLWILVADVEPRSATDREGSETFGFVERPVEGPRSCRWPVDAATVATEFPGVSRKLIDELMMKVHEYARTYRDRLVAKA